MCVFLSIFFSVSFFFFKHNNKCVLHSRRWRGVCGGVFFCAAQTVVRLLCGVKSGMTKSSSSLVGMMTTLDGDDAAVLADDDADDDEETVGAAAAALAAMVESDSDCAFNCHLASWTG